MSSIEPVVFAYIIVYLLALLAAVIRRKTFPLGEALAVVPIVGFGFTGLVYLVTLPMAEPLPPPAVAPGEIGFTLAYLVFVAVLLVPGAPVPAAWKGVFLKNKAVTMLFKVGVFVLVPLVVLRRVWSTPWDGLGFTAGDLLGQLGVALILILLFGGFNLAAGGGAAPIRARKFSLRQVVVGMGLAFVWNIIEVGLVEEFFFRAFVQSRLIGFFDSPASGICAASLLFGLAHAPGITLRSGDRHGPLGEKPALVDSILYTILVLSTTGWFTGLLYWHTQSLLAPVLVHAGLDAVPHAVEFIEELGIR